MLPLAIKIIKKHNKYFNTLQIYPQSIIIFILAVVFKATVPIEES